MNDLDLSRSAPSVDVSQPQVPLAAPSEPLRIALAEDNGALRRLLTLVLLRDGHEVSEARDAAELLELMASCYAGGGAAPFDLVICEQTMPGISGISVLAGLRTRDRTTPFILITADEDVQQRARRLGGVVLDHPFTLAAIRRAIREAAEFPPPRND
jgi:CheY-like chemotaxis protein